MAAGKIFDGREKANGQGRLGRKVIRPLPQVCGSNIWVMVVLFTNMGKMVGVPEVGC